MTHIITIETLSENDFALTNRLGLHMEEAHIDSDLSETKALYLLDRVAGSWVGDETSDELNATLQNARYFRDRDLKL